MMKPVLRWIFLPFVLFGLMVLFVAADVPERELKNARQVLHEAFEKGAPMYSPLVYAKAEGALQAAEDEIAEQQHRWIWERDYSLAIDMLAWAIIDAVTAAEDAIMAKDKIQAYYGLDPLGADGLVSPKPNSGEYVNVSEWPG